MAKRPCIRVNDEDLYNILAHILDSSDVEVVADRYFKNKYGIATYHVKAARFFEKLFRARNNL